ncbi:hypothetical protein BCR37DRAFT_100223 [Protomyces lactucae-debilis]|uniref:Long chronological lifespan protein 2 n=1 Tax=Protomyces lactucae-debilis TaxID=2754530 RepID=A0A1Y2F7V6_PROLT|nr:uncharacterized protein BCR37DRAFT_100223 [Protomyces lactucae-debilis]ORY78995.1 hypothetical protein BCR37DRAFT_100223 [Protomyces lactucae-debilis]
MQLVTLITALFITAASAQFQFFDSMFGGHGHPQQQQHQKPVRGPDWYNGLALNTECDEGAYLCPGTMDCVEKPGQCPCPHDLARCEVGAQRVCVSKQAGVKDVCAAIKGFHETL